MMNGIRAWDLFVFSLGIAFPAEPDFHEGFLLLSPSIIDQLPLLTAASFAKSHTVALLIEKSVELSRAYSAEFPFPSIRETVRSSRNFGRDFARLWLW